MDDVLTPEQRKKNMKNIRSKNTKIEVILRKKLWGQGVRYRTNYKCLPGKPDIAITKFKIAVFYDSEFFHGKNWEEQKKRIMKGDNGSFWVEKIEGNIRRDDKVNSDLKKLGWTVLRFWGEEIKKASDKCVEVILHEIEKREQELTIKKMMRIT